MCDLIDQRTPTSLGALSTVCHGVDRAGSESELWDALVQGVALIPGVTGVFLIGRFTAQSESCLLASNPENLEVTPHLERVLTDAVRSVDHPERSVHGIKLPTSVSGAGLAIRECAGMAGPLVLFVQFPITVDHLPPDVGEALRVAGTAASLRSRVLFLESETERLHQEMARDHLTGIKNRAYAIQSLTREIALARRRRSPLALIMLDIDNFKRFNDTYGHLTGDRVLCEVARVLERTARCGDVISRYGGEEFLVVLPDTTLENAQLFAERLRGAIERYGRRLGRLFPDLELTISLGVTSLSVLSDTLEDAIARADRALYASKANGRNQVNVGPAPHQLDDVETHEGKP